MSFYFYFQEQIPEKTKKNGKKTLRCEKYQDIKSFISLIKTCKIQVQVQHIIRKLQKKFQSKDLFQHNAHRITMNKQLKLTINF